MYTISMNDVNETESPKLQHEWVFVKDEYAIELFIIFIDYFLILDVPSNQ